MTNLKLLHEALNCAKAGIPVFPCYPRTKRPAIGGGFKSASSDPDIVRMWWTEMPDANIGMPTGSVTELFVLDVDRDKGGFQSLQALQQMHSALPETAISETGGGGRHYFFKHPGFRVHNSTSKIAPGIDIKGDGGYVIIPPSVHSSGKRYRWLPYKGKKSLTDASAEVLDFLRPAEPRPTPIPIPPLPNECDILKRAAAYVDATPEAISGQGGHSQTFGLASTLIHGFRLSQEDALNLLKNRYNPRCQPPWSDKELEHKMQSALDHPPNKMPGWMLNSELAYPDVDITRLLKRLNVYS
jgi:hypothetical protein